MIEIPYLKDFLTSIKKTAIDDFVDRLNYYYTAILLTFFALVTGAKQTIGKPIECMMPAEYPTAWSDYARQYCYVTTTYSVNETSSIGDGQNGTSHGYYQIHLGSALFCGDFHDVISLIEGSYSGKRSSKNAFFVKLQTAVEAIALCHNVTPIEEDGETEYQAGSPDEIALVEWTEKVGVRLAFRDLAFMELRTKKWKSKEISNFAYVSFYI